MTTPIAVDLFAGAGFMGNGFTDAGFRIPVAVEFNKAHVASHELNFPDTNVICDDIRQVSGNQIRMAGGIGNATVDLVIGGSPCQGFSRQGHNDPNDERRSLAFDFIRIVDELQSRYFVFENVKGLTNKKNKKAFRAILDGFTDVGYALSYKVLNACDFGVAQNRERVIIIGHRVGNAPLDWDLKKLPRVTCGDVLADLEDRDVAETLCGHDLVRHSQKTINRFSTVEPGRLDKVSKFPRLRVDGISPTLLAGTPKGSDKNGRHTGKRPIHYKFDRVLTVRELMRIHGIADQIKLGKPYTTICDAVMQIGNSVPPPMAFAIAQMVMRSVQVPVVEVAA